MTSFVGRTRLPRCLTIERATYRSREREREREGETETEREVLNDSFRTLVEQASGTRTHFLHNINCSVQRSASNYSASQETSYISVTK